MPISFEQLSSGECEIIFHTLYRLDDRHLVIESCQTERRLVQARFVSYLQVVPQLILKSVQAAAL